MSALKEYLNSKVRLITTDGRLFEGQLEGFDNSTNIALSHCIEIIVHEEEGKGTQIANIGGYLVRGDSVVCIGQTDEEAGNMQWDKIRGCPIKSTKNPL